jgi:hypothetical protein
VLEAGFVNLVREPARNDGAFEVGVEPPSLDALDELDTSPQASAAKAPKQW